jgi:hypothetical protein
VAGLKDWEEVTKKRRLDMLERVVFPSIGKLPVRQITRPTFSTFSTRRSSGAPPP